MRNCQPCRLATRRQPVQLARCTPRPTKHLHTMVRVAGIEASLRFYRQALGLELLSRKDSEAGRVTLMFLVAPGDYSAQVELTYNWPAPNGTAEAHTHDRNFSHLAPAEPWASMPNTSSWQPASPCAS